MAKRVADSRPKVAKKAPKKETRPNAVAGKNTTSSTASTRQPKPALPPLKLNLLHQSTHGDQRPRSQEWHMETIFTTRLDKASNENLQLVGRLSIEQNNNNGNGGPQQRFVVLEPTSAVFTCTIGRFVSCTCKDNNENDNVCKHLIFVMLRVLDVPRTSPLLAQKAFLRSEVVDIIESGKRTVVKKQYLAETISRRQHCPDNAYFEIEKTCAADIGHEPEQKIARNKGSECSVCFEKLLRNLVICDECKNAVHKQCWEQYEAVQDEPNQCLLCRGEFVQD